MSEPTSANEFTQLPTGGTAPFTDGEQVMLSMSCYARTDIVSEATASNQRTVKKTTMVAADGGCCMIDLNPYGVPPGQNYTVSYSNYMTGDTTNMTGDVFTIRTWPAVAGEAAPPALEGKTYQKVCLQTADGLYVRSDGQGYCHSTVQEPDADVFLLVIGGPVYQPHVTLYPTFYTFGQRATADAELKSNIVVGLFSLQFVQPTIGGGVSGNYQAVPMSARGPIMVQRMQGVPQSATIYMAPVSQKFGVTMPFANGDNLIDIQPRQPSYLVLDGELRQTGGAALFNPGSGKWVSQPRFKYPIGDPIAGASLVTVAGQPCVWMLIDGVKRGIESPAVMKLFDFNWAVVQTIPAEDLEGIPDGPPIGMNLDTMPFPSGACVHESDTGRIYLAIDGHLRWVPNPTTYDNLFASWVITHNVVSLPPLTYRIGPPITDGAYLAQANGAVYLMVDGLKRHIRTPAAMTRFNFAWNKIQTPPVAQMDAVSQGADIEF